jgi:hypothetical protein
MTEYPECGFFKLREKAWSPIWIPARIWLDQPMDWQTGELSNPERFLLEIDGRLITDQEKIELRWLRLTPATMDEWKWLRARRALQSSSPAIAFG